MKRAFFGMLLAACGSGTTTPPDPGPPDMVRMFTTPDAVGCYFASPILYQGEVIAVSGDGVVSAFEPTTGDLLWSAALPAGAGTAPNVAATPGLTGHDLVVAWQEVTPDFTRTAHHVSVVDLDAHALDGAFPALTLTADEPDADGTGIVSFSPANSYSRSAVPIAHPPGSTLGIAYVAYGNIMDIQPWHGWVYEIDLDAWQVTGVLLTTPESDCGPSGVSGSLDMVCGGGVWTPAGPQIFPAANADGYELIVPTGNGALELQRGDYANTLMRSGRGLAFDPGCDPTACAAWDVTAPSEACMTSCRDLFIPRMLPGQAPLDPPDGRCDGVSFFECYAKLDYDLGADAPVKVQVPGGPEVYVLPAKDGSVYLVDADNMGTLYDRLVVMPVCGSGGGTCSANWAGMMVTQPEMIELQGEPVALIPTFVYDTTHPAGLVAVRIAMTDGAPRLTRIWEAPDFDTEEALERFRRHAGRAAAGTWGGETYAWIVDVGEHGGAAGTLLTVRASDGTIVDRAPLTGPGQRYVRPLVDEDRVYVTSCESNDGPGRVEAFRITAPAL